MSVPDQFSDGWIEGLLEPFLSSPYLGELSIALLVWATLGVGFYIYSRGVILPLVLSILFGGVIAIAMPSTVGSVIVFVLMVGIPSFAIAVIWMLYR